MPRNNEFKGYNVNPPKKQTLDINVFRGVDYSPAQLGVDNFHAVDIKNIIWKDNINQKRNGYEVVAEVPNIEYYPHNQLNKTYKNDEKQINGVYELIDENKIKHTLVHSGKLMFEIFDFGNNYDFTRPNWEVVNSGTYNGKPVCVELNNTVSAGFFGANRLYLLDGDKYRVIFVKNGKVSIEDVEDNDKTYIPTTTVGIGVSWKIKDASSGELKDYISSSPTPLDDVNMMTQWRKNKLVTGLYTETEYSYKDKFYKYTLDTNVLPKKREDINDILITINTTEAYKNGNL